MTIEEVKTNGAPSGAANPQNPAPAAAPAPQGAGDTPTTPPAQPSFSVEQQAVVDKIVADRLKRAQEKWAADQQAKAKADADAAEAERQKAQGEWEALARKHEAKAAELAAKLQQVEFDQQRRDAAQAAGIPDFWERLRGETAEELAEDAKALAAMVQPANGQPGRTATPPTPAAQTGKGNYVQDAIERQNKRATEDDPFAAMMKR